MTAEIAILNKTAVVLAADSAVTISAGSDQQKIYDSEDKLFELTRGNAIGIMINSSMNFMEAPLPVLIKRYRSTAPRFTSVLNAAEHFLRFLDEFGRLSPDRIKRQSVTHSMAPVFKLIESRATDRWRDQIFKEEGGLRQEIVDEPDKVAVVLNEALDNEISFFEDLASGLMEATFIGEGPLVLEDADVHALRQLAAEHLTSATDEQRDRAVQMAQVALCKVGTSVGSTGVVVAGFGSEDLFPTLISYDVFGMVGNRLKYHRQEVVDIDRDGHRARVMPFAQREMVERFLYGLDGSLQTEITNFCKEAVPSISETLIDTLVMEDADREAIKVTAVDAERAFYEGLETKGFEAIQKISRTEIEDMVEFMPKPEMAKMAEALVNLTSLKRRVSRGFETVGGPIDVAVISQAEGFVWVKRKHYFPPELNSRYFGRIGGTNYKEEDGSNA